jgi:hypothetical protein
METGRAHLRAAIVAGAAALAAAAPAPRARAADEALPAAPAVDAASPARDAAARPPESPAEARRRARTLFFVLRGRGPTPEERDALAALPHADAVDRLLADPATWEAWLDRELWYFLLIDRFRPVSDRVTALPARLARGEATAKDAVREIVVSAEFNARNPGNDTFVTVVLEQLLGIVVQEKTSLLAAAKKAYDGVPSRVFGEVARSQSDFVRVSLGQRAFADLFAARQYREVFGRAPGKEALARDAARLHEDPGAFRAVLREWLVSGEWIARSSIPRPKDDRVFLRTLFVDLLGREPTFDEFRNSRNAFLAMSDPAPVRNVLAQLLLDSGRAAPPSKEELARPADWVRDRFLHLLGREPTPRESDAFVATLGEYGCEPKTLILAIVTSPEYQYF